MISFKIMSGNEGLSLMIRIRNRRKDKADSDTFWVCCKVTICILNCSPLDDDLQFGDNYSVLQKIVI